MDRDSTQQHSAAADTRLPGANAPTRPGQPVLSSDDLLRGHSSVAITHNGACYRLQTTRQGKLILTK